VDKIHASAKAMFSGNNRQKLIFSIKNIKINRNLFYDIQLKVLPNLKLI